MKGLILAAAMLLTTMTANAAIILHTEVGAWTGATSGVINVADWEGLGGGVASGIVATGVEYSGLGMTYANRDGLDVFIGRTGFGAPGNILGEAGVSSSFGTTFDDARSDNIDFTFTTGAASAGLWSGNLNPGPTRVEFLAPDLLTILAAIDLTDAHPDLVTDGSTFNNRIFVGVTTTAGELIGAIRTVEPALDGDLIMYDNVSWVNADVPAPAGLGLLVLGLAAIRLRRRSHLTA